MWHIEYYNSGFGPCPVEKYINSLDVTSQAMIGHMLELLEEFGINMGAPYVRHIEKQLWELRIHRNRLMHYVIYFWDIGETLVLMRVFSRTRYSLTA